MQRYTPFVIVLTLCAGCAMFSGNSGASNAGARARITGESPYRHDATAEAAQAAERKGPTTATSAQAAATNRPADTGDRRTDLPERGASIDQFTTRGARDTSARAQQASDTRRVTAQDATLWWVIGIGAVVLLCSIMLLWSRRRHRDEYETRRVETREVRRPEERIGGRTAVREMRV
jgi:hypothetical protein